MGKIMGHGFGRNLGRNSRDSFLVPKDETDYPYNIYFDVSTMGHLNVNKNNIYFTDFFL